MQFLIIILFLALTISSIDCFTIYTRIIEKMTNYSTNLLQTVHESVPLPKTGEVFYCKGEYEYWHYSCDGFNDQVSKIIVHLDNLKN